MAKSNQTTKEELTRALTNMRKMFKDREARLIEAQSTILHQVQLLDERRKEAVERLHASLPKAEPAPANDAAPAKIPTEFPHPFGDDFDDYEISAMAETASCSRWVEKTQEQRECAARMAERLHLAGKAVETMRISQEFLAAADALRKAMESPATHRRDEWTALQDIYDRARDKVHPIQVLAEFEREAFIDSLNLFGLRSADKLIANAGARIALDVAVKRGYLEAPAPEHHH